MATLERKVQDAQTALARVEPTGNYRELKDLEDDLAYLRVKARRGETVTARERRDLSDRIDRFMTRVGGTSTSTNNSTGYDTPRHARSRHPPGTSQASSARVIPAGSELDVRLVTTLTSDTAKVEDAVEATTMVDLYRGDDLIVPSGSKITGYVSSVEPRQPHRSQGQPDHRVHAADRQRAHPRRARARDRRRSKARASRVKSRALAPAPALARSSAAFLAA